MKTDNFKHLSRRKWLTHSSTIAAALLGSGIATERVLAEDQTPATSPDASGAAGGKIYNIADFGAVGDGTTLNTSAVQAAVDSCFKDGGGTVLVPTGVFQIGMVELKSNVTLHISAGGTLLGTADGKQYHHVDAVPLKDEPGEWTMGDGNVALIYAVKANNITVEGPGTIDGQGVQFSRRNNAPPAAGIGGTSRPYHLMFYQCTNLRVRDIFLKDCAYHSIRVVRCDYSWFKGIRIHSRVNSNNDGFHFVSCKHCHISDCIIECADDGCAMFGSCQNFTITNCEFSTRWSVFRFAGGFARDIAVSNCVIYEAFGCPIKIATAPNSRFERLSFSDLIMYNVTGPIFIGMGRERLGVGLSGGYDPSSTNAGTNPAANQSGVCRDISFNNIRAVVSKPYQLPDFDRETKYNPAEIFSCIGLNGADARFMENISFNNVHVVFPGGGTAEQAAVRDVPRAIGEYFIAGVLPAYALYARHVRGLTLNNVRFEIAASDLRPAIVFDRVYDACVSGLNVHGDENSESALRIIDGHDIYMTATRLLKPAKVFARIEGRENSNITIDGGDFGKAAKTIEFANGADEKSVKVRV